MVQPPNPIVPCARCLWIIGYGYDRISRLLFGTSQEKHRIYRWRKYHQWPDHPNAFKAYYTALRRLPRPTSKRSHVVQTLEQKRPPTARTFLQENQAPAPHLPLHPNQPVPQTRPIPQCHPKTRRLFTGTPQIPPRITIPSRNELGKLRTLLGS